MAARLARGEDGVAITGVIADAFRTDPLWSWAMRREDGGTQHHASLWRIFVAGALRYPFTWTTDAYEAVSVWIPPDGTELSEDQEAELDDTARQLLGSRADLYLELLDRFDAAHPRGEAHYYLSLLGTASAARGRGLGMALLRANLSTLDDLGAPAYLESSNPANDRRYESLGFEKVGEFQGPEHGPTVSTMWRSPR
jgi:GNAT superfamily N-acetyltransferase